MYRLFTKVFVLSALIVSFLYIPSLVRAHGSSVPYVKINDTYVFENPIKEAAVSKSFLVGSDIATSSGYLVNEPVVFAIDEQLFPNPYGTSSSVFQWNFADGTEKVEGQRVIHTFTKPGTYIVELAAAFPGKTQDFSEVDTIQLSILPSKDYALPVAKIKINGKRIGDKQFDITTIQPMTRITFDASESTGSGMKYIWDFGDDTEITKQIVVHRYHRDDYLPIAVLRVTDANNIMTDTYAQMDIPIQSTNPILSLYYFISDFVTGLVYKE
jgi:hypothetical protein